MVGSSSSLGVSSVAQRAVRFTRRSLDKFPGIVEFVTSSGGLNQRIFPAQRFFLKAFEKEDLDDTISDIEIRDKFNSNILHKLTERGYYTLLRNEGRFSLDYETYQNTDIVQIIMFMGRRASKSTMVGMWLATKLAQLLVHEKPQDFFGIVGSDRMNISLTALGEDNAIKLFGKLASLIQAAPYFKPFLLEPAATSSMKLWTRHDLETMRDKRIKAGDSAHTNSINITAQANSPGVRGDNNIYCVLEEFAHFNLTKGAQKGEKQLDERIHEALAPSVSGFKAPDGGPYGKTLIITSPNGAQGKAFFEYDQAFKLGADSYTLAMSAPTWEVNPLVGSAFLKKEYNSSPTTYDQEYGAKIVSSGLSWIRDLPTFYLAPQRSAVAEPPVGRIDRTYFMGIDFALSNDATSVAICHYEPRFVDDPDEYIPEAFAYNPPDREWMTTEPRGVFVVDYLGERFAGRPPFEKRSTLLIEDVLDWIELLFRLWPISGGIYDQWSGEIIKQLIEARGLGRKLTMLNMTEAANDSLAKLFSEVLHDRRLKLPNDPGLLQNLLRLQVEHRPKGTIRVEAPPGAHDDDYSALSRAIWCCSATINRSFVLGGQTVNLNLSAAVERGLDFSKARDPKTYAKLQEMKHQSQFSLRNPAVMANRMRGMAPGRIR